MALAVAFVCGYTQRTSYLAQYLAQEEELQHHTNELPNARQHIHLGTLDTICGRSVELLSL